VPKRDRGQEQIKVGTIVAAALGQFLK